MSENEEKKLARLHDKKQRLEKKVQTEEVVCQAINKELKELKDKFADNEQFQEYEKYLDEGIDLSRLTYNEMRFLRKDLQIIFQD